MLGAVALAANRWAEESVFFNGGEVCDFVPRVAQTEICRFFDNDEDKAHGVWINAITEAVVMGAGHGWQILWDSSPV